VSAAPAAKPHYYTLQTPAGYVGVYASRADAEHGRRLLFGIRALAHPIVRVVGRPRGGAA